MAEANSPDPGSAATDPASARVAEADEADHEDERHRRQRGKLGIMVSDKAQHRLSPSGAGSRIGAGRAPVATQWSVSGAPAGGRRRLAAAGAFLLVASCSAPTGPGDEAGNRSEAPSAAAGHNAASPAPAAQAAPAPAAPTPDNRAAAQTARADEKGPEAAAEIVRRYFDLVAAHRYGEARRLWDRGGDASGKSDKDFAADFGHYGDYHARVGTPGRMEGAAGSSFIEVPVELYGHLGDGTPFRRAAKVTLRRVNDVPGSTAEQRRWHISDIAAGDAPEG